VTFPVTLFGRGEVGSDLRCGARGVGKYSDQVVRGIQSPTWSKAC
jgi:hypothetical protein